MQVQDLPDEEQTPRYRVSLAGLLLFGTESALAQHCQTFETAVITQQGTKRFRKVVVESYKMLCGSRGRFCLRCAPQFRYKTIRELFW